MGAGEGSLKAYLQEFGSAGGWQRKKCLSALSWGNEFGCKFVMRRLTLSRGS